MAVALDKKSFAKMKIEKADQYISKEDYMTFIRILFGEFLAWEEKNRGKE